MLARAARSHPRGSSLSSCSRPVVPEKIVTSIDPLENWRDGFDKMIRGEGAKGVIVLDDTLK